MPSWRRYCAAAALRNLIRRFKVALYVITALLFPGNF